MKLIILLPLIFYCTIGPIIRPAPGTYPVLTPITIVLEDLHACLGMWVSVEGLSSDQYQARGDCDSGIGIVSLVVLVPATVKHITITPIWFNGDPFFNPTEVYTWFEFTQ